MSEMKFLKAFLAFAMVFTSMLTAVDVHAAPATEEYEIYPNPQAILYKDTHTTLTSEVNVVYEEGVDADTKARLTETLAQKDITVSSSDAIVEGKTNVLVGIHESTKYVDQYVKDHITVNKTDLFTKKDAYMLHVENNVITVLGKDSDSAFYGLTTLYHIVSQMPEMTMRDLHIEDFADIVSRGFIEGYYGNPWTTQDRIDLMTWGGYYKLNSYFYAPKDDPKHRVQWRQLYSEQEINEKIKPLAEAGNASKCRFVYALHPFPHEDFIKFENTYEKDLADLKAKFKQVIDAGVRQIAILADDFHNPGGPNGKRLLEDMTNWLKDEIIPVYPDMKLNIPYVPYDYMGNGSGAELQALKNAPENIQLVMTGGRVWGEVSQNFTNTFTGNVGRGPYLWINWPCTDNSKKHLIMGGYSDFLHPGVNPENIQGIVLNPMQQSEPSKVAIFGNACYAWNIWESAEEANQAWYDSFDYVDHNSAENTNAGSALRELSKHMINQNMDSRVRVLEESVELKEKLNPMKTKLMNDTLTAEDLPAVEALIEEFTTLQDAANVYRQEASNTKVRDQIVYWLNCWDDTTKAAIDYLNAVKAYLNNDNETFVNLVFSGEQAWAQSKTYNFHYVDHDEFAEVGVQHIVPFINSLGTYAMNKLQAELDPNFVSKQYITNREDGISAGRVENVFDGDDRTTISYQSAAHNMIKQGQYFGVMFNKLQPLKNLRILQGSGKNHYEHSQLEYTTDGQQWQALELQGMENNFTATQGQPLEIVVEENNLPKDLNVLGIRCIATQDNRLDAWLEIAEIQVNRTKEVKYTLQHTDRFSVAGGAWKNLYDGNDNTFVYIDPDGSQNSTRDTFKVGDFIGYDLGQVVTLDSAHIVIGHPTKITDKIVNYAIETSVDNQTWTAVPGYENYTGNTNQLDKLDINLRGVEARYIRIRNTQDRNTWGYFSEFTVKTSETLAPNTNADLVLQAKRSPGLVALESKDVTLNKDQFIEVELPYIYKLTIPTLQAIEQIDGLNVEVTENNVVWSNANDFSTGYKVRLIATKDGVNFNANLLNVRYEYIGDYKVSYEGGNNDARRDMRTAGNVKNVFDGKLGTKGSITDTQRTDKPITFDLGHVVDFSSIRYYVVESSQDFLRHAKFEVSVNGKDQWQEVLVVGKEGQANSYNEDTAKTQDYLVHDTKNPGYMYAENRDLNVSGRYIRVTPLSNYSFRWMDFSEIQINDGVYIPRNDILDVTGSPEVEGHQPYQAIDGNFTTTYKQQISKDGTYHLTYKIRNASSNNKQIRIIQKGEPSNATVRIFNGTGEEGIFVGRLTNSINDLPLRGTTIEVRITSDKPLEILEMILLTEPGSQELPADPTKLEQLIRACQKYIKEGFYTEETWVVYSAKLEEAKAVLGKPDATNKEYVDAHNALYEAARALKPLDDEALTNNLAEVVKKAEALKEEDYTSDSWSLFKKALDEAKAVLGNKDATPQQKQVAAGLLQTAMDDLTFKPVVQEVDKTALNKAIKDAKGYKESDYTQASWSLFKEAFDHASAVAASQTATQEEVNQAKDLLVAAMGQLEAKKPEKVDKSKLEALVAEATDYKEKDYTASTFKSFRNALDAAIQVLASDNATKEQVKTAYNQLKAAMEQLVLITGQPNDVQTPDTGDTTIVLPMVAMMGVAMVGAYILLKKKKSCNS